MNQVRKGVEKIVLNGDIIENATVMPPEEIESDDDLQPHLLNKGDVTSTLTLAIIEDFKFQRQDIAKAPEYHFWQVLNKFGHSIHWQYEATKEPNDIMALLLKGYGVDPHGPGTVEDGK